MTEFESVYDGIRESARKGIPKPALDQVYDGAVTAILHIPKSCYDTVAWPVKLKDCSSICTVEFVCRRSLVAEFARFHTATQYRGSTQYRESMDVL